MVEEHGGDDAGISGVVVGDVGVGGVGPAEAGAGVRGLGDRVGHVLGVGAQDGGQHLAQCGLFGVGVQEVDVRLEGVDVEGGEQGGGLERGAETAQAVELREGADEFRLVVGVLVVAVARVDRDSAPLLVLVALPGLFEVGVDLEGEGAPHGEELQEEREAGAELGDRLEPQLTFRGLVDHLGEGAAPGARGCAGVGAHPHLRLRLAGGGHAEELRDGGGRTPGVGADGVVEAVHGVCFSVGGELGRGPGQGRAPVRVRLRKRATGKRRRNP